MKLESDGIIISLKPFGERDCIGRAFTRGHGVMSGVFKAGQIAKARPLAGQFGRISWSARLETQLGAFHLESEKNLIAPLFSRRDALARANACFALLAALLPERETYVRLFEATLEFLRGGDYLEWEVGLLADLGYGLALEKCGHCGSAGGLAYISPKSGRAICEKCGAAYGGKMFRFPVDLAATKHFLRQIAPLPPEREIL
jgi:DNA repair protein RecO (recombination protein O)